MILTHLMLGLVVLFSVTNFFRIFAFWPDEMSYLSEQPNWNFIASEKWNPSLAFVTIVCLSLYTDAVICTHWTLVSAWIKLSVQKMSMEWFSLIWRWALLFCFQWPISFEFLHFDQTKCHTYQNSLIGILLHQRNEIPDWHLRPWHSKSSSG